MMLFGIEKMIQYWSKLSEVILLHCITYNIPVISGPVIGKKYICVQCSHLTPLIEIIVDTKGTILEQNLKQKNYPL